MFCWGCETPIDPDVAEVKTIGSRYCGGCVDKEAAVHGLPVGQITEKRSRSVVEPCGHGA
jgi:hypothetical protein